MGGFPDVFVAVEGAGGPAVCWGPVGGVVSEPVAELMVFFAGGWEHRDEPAAMVRDVVHVVAGPEFGVGNIEEVGSADEGDEAVPGVGVGGVVVGVS